MLFRKKIERSCQYCACAAKLAEGGYLCSKRGIIDGEKPCRKFVYDPCKRIPSKPKPVNFRKYDGEDFTL